MSPASSPAPYLCNHLSTPEVLLQATVLDTSAACLTRWLLEARQEREQEQTGANSCDPAPRGFTAPSHGSSHTSTASGNKNCLTKHFIFSLFWHIYKHLLRHIRSGKNRLFPYSPHNVKHDSHGSTWLNVIIRDLTYMTRLDFHCGWHSFALIGWISRHSHQSSPDLTILLVIEDLSSTQT